MKQQESHFFACGNSQHLLTGDSETAFVVDRVLWLLSVVQIKSKLRMVFFTDDYSGFAPLACNQFKEFVGADPGEIRPMRQGRLF